MKKQDTFGNKVLSFIKSKLVPVCILSVLVIIFFIFIFWPVPVIRINNLIAILSPTVAAATAVFIAIIQINRIREENRLSREYQTRKDFMIYTFKEIIPSIRLLRDSLSHMNAFYISLPINLRLNIESPKVFKFDTPEIRQKLLLERIQVSRSVAEFLTSFECVEISMIDLIEYKEFLSGRLNDFLGIENHEKNGELIETLLSKISGVYHKRASYLKELEKATDECSEKIMEIVGWLYDFVIILQNHFLSDVFNTKLPMRKTLDPKYKILTEVVHKKILKNDTHSLI